MTDLGKKINPNLAGKRRIYHGGEEEVHGGHGAKEEIKGKMEKSKKLRDFPLFLFSLFSLLSSFAFPSPQSYFFPEYIENSSSF